MPDPFTTPDDLLAAIAAEAETLKAEAVQFDETRQLTDAAHAALLQRLKNPIWAET